MASCGAPLFHNVSEYLAQVGEALRKVVCIDIERVVQVLLQTHDAGRTIFLFGNGGSASLASHMACDLGKGMSDVLDKRIRVLSLTDNVALLTAWANDIAYDQVFAEQLKNFIQPGDIAFAISGSGNSPSVLAGLRTAKGAGAITMGLTGFQGGKMKQLCDVCVVVPSENMQIIEDMHMILAHGMFHTLRARLQERHSMAIGEEGR